MSKVKCYGIGTGRISLMMKSSRDAAKYISGLEGFQGVHFVPDGRCLWIFDTMNHAKVARNKMESKGIEYGRNIAEIYVDEQYLKRGTDDERTTD